MGTVALRDIRKGLAVRRGGTPKTPQGKARKAETFVVTEIQGKPTAGFCRVRLEGAGRAFWVYALHLASKKWELA